MKERRVKVAAIGAGNRMRTYMHYVAEHPEKVELVAVAEPNELRLKAMGDGFGLGADRRFKNYDDFFAHSIEADGVMIATPDDKHFAPCMKALEAGYNILIEKPVAQRTEEWRQIEEKAREKNLRVSVCYVLRYHPLFVKLREIVASGRLGKIIAVEHCERVGLDRTTHSYVRGIWNTREKGNEMLLAKCCHDVDLLLWLTGEECRRVSSFGSLRWFRAENAPEGAAERCVDCAREQLCPYSAVDLYRRRREWIGNFDVGPLETLDEVIERELRVGRQGRCVFRCENDVVDNQAVLMEMTDGTVVTLSMSLFTIDDHRSTDIHLSEGEIYADEKTIRITDFRTREREELDFSHLKGVPYHAGADLAIVEEFVDAIAEGRGIHGTSIGEALKSHYICHAADVSRLTGRVVSL